MNTADRIPCPTVYPERRTWVAGMKPDDPPIVAHNVPCEGRLVVCHICGKPRRCTREARCLDDQTPAHVVKYRFGIEDMYHVEGYTRGETWNGWECPRFPLASALAIMQEMNDAAPDSIAYDEATQTITWTPHDDPDARDAWTAELMETQDGSVLVFAIGAWAWIWDRVEYGWIK